MHYKCDMHQLSNLCLSPNTGQLVHVTIHPAPRAKLYLQKKLDLPGHLDSDMQLGGFRVSMIFLCTCLIHEASISFATC